MNTSSGRASLEAQPIRKALPLAPYMTSGIPIGDDASPLPWTSSERDWRHKSNGQVLRVIDYHLEGIEGSEPIYRLATTVLDPGKSPAGELAALYHERWEIETAFDELKTHLRGAKIVLRSKTPDLVRQEFYGS